MVEAIASPAFERIKQLFELKRAEKWKHAEIIRFWSEDGRTVEPATAIAGPPATADAQKSLDDGDKPERISTISFDNPINDFKAMVSDRHCDLVVPAFKQMMTLIPRYASAKSPESTTLALQCFQVLREAAISEDEPDMFNAYLQELKRLRQLAPSEFPQNLWESLAKANCTLISRSENHGSLVSTEHAQDFFSS